MGKIDACGPNWILPAATDAGNRRDAAGVSARGAQPWGKRYQREDRNVRMRPMPRLTNPAPGRTPYENPMKILHAVWAALYMPLVKQKGNE